jgi:hypothetical protein
MRPLETVYWLRFAFGILAAFLSIVYGVATNEISSMDFSFYTFLNTMSIAIIIYMVSYYYVKFRYTLQVKNPRKLITTGIGIYFLSWIAFWVLLYTMIAGPPA